MEHVIKQTEDETIKRFEVPNGSIWLVRFGNQFGVGKTKKQAEKAAYNHQWYAEKGTPRFINDLGSTWKYNNRPVAYSVPKAISFIWQMIPSAWKNKYIFRVIVDQENTATLVEVGFVSDALKTWKPLRYSSDDKQGFHQQVTNCIYRFYTDNERSVDPATQRLQHPKLAEWQEYWYSKLTPRRAP